MDISKQSQARIDWLQAMPAAAQFEAIAMGIKNPQIYSQFLALDEGADIAEYAYAAGLISKADAVFIKQEPFTYIFEPINDHSLDVHIKIGEEEVGITGIVISGDSETGEQLVYVSEVVGDTLTETQKAQIVEYLESLSVEEVQQLIIDNTNMQDETGEG